MIIFLCANERKFVGEKNTQKLFHDNEFNKLEALTRYQA